MAIQILSKTFFAAVLLFACIAGCSKGTIPKLAEQKVLGLEFVEIPTGKFLMGHKLEKPIHEVSLDGFWIMKYEVTEKQYSKYLVANGMKAVGVSEKPITNIDRREAQKYIDWLNKQSEIQFDLPSEAQWEYAARGGYQGFDFPWGDGYVEGYAAVLEDPIQKVGSFPPNGYGLFDMCGNVAEMCRGVYYDYPNHPVRNPEPPTLDLTDDEEMYITRGLGCESVYPQVWIRIGSGFVNEVPPSPTGIRLVIKNNPTYFEQMKPPQYVNE
ncbi:MAG: SUMF1/EgtB/PvdO family nonheme iron enzyme [Armatimonadetes bacterium]|nr:SUMF1/EgtB/PvdO family nonheme iron enzyme [Armatimonadota bacterium]